MTNEQTQAEKLAAEVAEKWKYVLPPRLQDNLHIHVAHAITQATAELRAENERLVQQLSEAQSGKEGWEKLAKELADGIREVFGVSQDDYGSVRLVELIRNTKAERDQAQAQVEELQREAVLQQLHYNERLESVKAQVAALVEDSRWIHGRLQASKTELMDELTGDFVECVLWSDIDPIFDIRQDLQATAEAHDAKVRQEAREAAIRECMKIIPDTFIGAATFNKKFQALLPQAEMEGGV